MPSWLWAKRPASDAPDTDRELSVAQVVARFCGALTAQGWKRGYFNRENDAHAFHDELQASLLRQKAVPKLDWLSAYGRNWAYGIEDGAVTASVAPALPTITGPGIARLPSFLQSEPAHYATLNLAAFRAHGGGFNVQELLHTARPVGAGPAHRGGGCASSRRGADANEFCRTAGRAGHPLCLPRSACFGRRSDGSGIRHGAQRLCHAGAGKGRQHRIRPAPAKNCGELLEAHQASVEALSPTHAPELALLAEARKLWKQALKQAEKTGLRGLAPHGILRYADGR